MRRVKITTGVVLVLIFTVMSIGCAGKAKTLRVAAAQFKVESGSALDAIDEMHKKEVAPPERTPAAVAAEFVDNASQSERAVTPDRIKLWANPNVVELNKETEKAWSEFISNLRLQYTTFAQIFDEIEQASFTGKKIVKKAAPYIQKLTAQLIYFADSIQQNPPQLFQRRTVLMTELQTIKNGSDDEADKRSKMAEWYDQWLALGADEKEIERATVEQCLKAALIGKEILKQTHNYNKLSLNDVTEALATVLGVAGAVTGRDFSQVQSQVDGIVMEINNDPVWEEVLKLASGEVNKVLGAQGTSTQ